MSVLGTILLVVGGWFLYWNLSGSATSHRYEINEKSQQKQAGIITQLRNYVQAYDDSEGPQKEQVRLTFCSMYETLTIVPNDIRYANERICR